MKEQQEFLSFDSLTNRITGALLAAAAGDAMGWTTEFIRSNEDLKRTMGVERITEYKNWSKRVGGKFQGYEDYIGAGEYSDDTQLTICTAACILTNGSFDYRTFCDVEYPMWLEYARGAGGTVKEAAHKIQRKSAQWNSNFFTRRIKEKVIDYRDGGANGAAMRISPHVLANVERWTQAEADIWRNSIISHGHPRAIIGALLYGHALYTALHWLQKDTGLKLIETLGNWTKQLETPQITGLKYWLGEWNNGRQETFETVFKQVQQETLEYLRFVYSALRKDESPETVLRQLGCLDFSTKGSGLSTAIAGIYLFARQPEQTQDNILIAANMIGTDTDSIAAFVGGLGGAAFGLESISKDWRARIQDAQFLTRLGTHLANIAMNEPSKMKIRAAIGDSKLGKALSRQVLEPDMRVAHYCLGSGTITRVDHQSLLSKDKTVTVISINFDLGQSCKFPLRTDAMSETLFKL